MLTGIIVAALVVGCVGIILGFFLGISGEKFKVEVDPREEAILEVLPGNNCGGCGYAGCSGLAAAIAKGEAPVGQCPVGGDPVAAKVGEIMGVSAGASVKKVAFVKCAKAVYPINLALRFFVLCVSRILIIEIIRVDIISRNSARPILSVSGGLSTPKKPLISSLYLNWTTTRLCIFCPLRSSYVSGCVSFMSSISSMMTFFSVQRDHTTNL